MATNHLHRLMPGSEISSKDVDVQRALLGVKEVRVKEIR
jgi:hypothetical protein